VDLLAPPRRSGKQTTSDIYAGLLRTIVIRIKPMDIARDRLFSMWKRIPTAGIGTEQNVYSVISGRAASTAAS
jgi:hypothetical protein